MILIRKQFNSLEITASFVFGLTCYKCKSLTQNKSFGDILTSKKEKKKKDKKKDKKDERKGVKRK